jgi:uncharacterized protein HemX
MDTFAAFGNLDWLGIILAATGSVFSAYLLIIARRDRNKSDERAGTALLNFHTAVARSIVLGTGGGGVNFTDVLRKPEDTKDRVARLVASLHESQRLIRELQAEIDAKAAAVARLQAEEEQSRQIAALREEEAAAVNHLISSTLQTAHDNLRRELERERDHLRNNLSQLQSELSTMQRTGRRDQWLFFAAGVLLSIPIGIAINIIF